MKANDKVPLSVNDIDATLQHGRIRTSEFWYVYWLFGVIGAGIILLVGLVMWISDPTYPVGIVATAFGAAMFVPSLLVFLFLYWGKWKVQKYLLHAVVLSAKTQKVYEDSESTRRRSGRVEALHVSFSYMGEDYIKSSSEKGCRGYIFIFNRYADKEILIAYSPRYDRVMLIKPESERRIRAERYEAEHTKDTP